MASIKQRQIASLKQMLNLNSGVSSSNFGTDTIFSVLIYDRHGQDIISPLLSVKELRNMGVTLHMLLHSDRGEIPDVPAIYFCQPSEENLVRISQDFADGLYSSFYLNFTSPISRQKMEDLAQAAIQSNCQNAVKKVFDQYINFICLEENMFCLKHQGSESLSYHALNRADASDTEIDFIIDSIVDSLFSVFVNLGQVPVIRSQRGNASEMVAERLDKKLRENLRDTRNSFFTGLGTDAFATGQLSFHRPLLVLVDRNLDLSTPLHHSWTYQALIHDLLSFHLNRVSLPQTEPGSNESKKKDYELDDSDLFWNTHKGSGFPMVAAAVETDLEEYKNSETKLKSLKDDIPNEQPENLFSDSTAILTSAITSLPELLKRKANIDKHMSIAMALLNFIKERKMDLFFEIEEKIMGRTALEKPFIEYVRDPEMGSANDKLRLFLIYYLCAPTEIPSAEMDALVEALKEAGANTGALAYVKRWKSLMKMTCSAPEYTGGVAKTVSMFSKLMNHGSAIVVEGVKNFVLKENKLPITRVVDNLMELKSCDEEKEFAYFDPKIVRASDSAAGITARAKTPFQEAVVFVVGGGNYVEYTNISSYLKSKATTTSKKITYGCTDVVNPDQFLSQLCKLGGAIA